MRERLGGIGHEQTSADGTATIEHAECLAACDLAPVLTVDYEFFDKQTVESAVEIIEALQRGEKPHPTRGAPLNDFRSVELLLAGFFDDPAVGGLAAVAGPSAAEESLRGARLAEERGWTAPARAGRGRLRMTDPLTPVLTKHWLGPESWTLRHYTELGGYEALRTALRDPARRPRRAREGLRPARTRRRRVPDGHEVELHPAGEAGRGRPPARRRSRSTSSSTPTRASRGPARTSR